MWSVASLNSACQSDKTEEFPQNLADTFTNLHCLPQGLMDHSGKRWTMMWLEVLLTGNPSTTVLQPFLVFEIYHPGEIYHEGVSLYHFCSSRRILTSLLNVCLFIHIRSMIVLGLSIKQKTVFHLLYMVETLIVMVCMGHTLFSGACDKTVESIEKKDHRNSLRK